MFCSSCGCQVDDQGKFCTSCGAIIQENRNDNVSNGIDMNNGMNRQNNINYGYQQNSQFKEDIKKAFDIFKSAIVNPYEVIFSKMSNLSGGVIAAYTTVLALISCILTLITLKLVGGDFVGVYGPSGFDIILWRALVMIVFYGAIILGSYLVFGVIMKLNSNLLDYTKVTIVALILEVVITLIVAMAFIIDWKFALMVMGVGTIILLVVMLEGINTVTFNKGISKVIYIYPIVYSIAIALSVYVLGRLVGSGLMKSFESLF